MNPDKLASASELARHIPNNSSRGHVSANTIRHWMREGIDLPDGTTVFLSKERVGGRLLTSLNRIKAFNAAVEQGMIDAPLTAA